MSHLNQAMIQERLKTEDSSGYHGFGEVFNPIGELLAAGEILRDGFAE